MRSLLAPVLFGTTLLALAAAPADVPLGLALLAVPAAVVLAAVASGGLTPLSAASGAAGAVAHAALAAQQPCLAGGALVAAAFLARTLRVPRLEHRVLAFALSAGLGTAAAAIAMRYVDAGAPSAVAAAVVAGLLASAAGLIPADDAMTRALRDLAAQAPEPLRVRLLRAAALRTSMRGGGLAVGVRAAPRVEGSFRALIVAARARVAADGPATALLDRSVAAHLRAIERIVDSAHEASARAAIVGDTALIASRAEGESLAAEAEALAELSSLSGEGVANGGHSG